MIVMTDDSNNIDGREKGEKVEEEGDCEMRVCLISVQFQFYKMKRVLEISRPTM